jgi:nitroreductase
MQTRDLTPDEVLATTRAVRRNLDFDRPVEREVLEECLQLALQAPTSSNRQHWRFVVVTDAVVKAQLAECYRAGWNRYAGARAVIDDPVMARIAASSSYLAERFHEVPAHVIPCVEGRPEGRSALALASMYGSIVQAAWSFQLAARVRGLGTCWTTLHLAREREAAEALGIPYDEVTQVALITVGYATRTRFRPAARRPLDEIVHWERW